MKYFSIILTVMVTALIGRATEPQTGWFFDQSTQQAFYILSDITIDGLVVEGDGSGEGDGECYASGNCDVVGAFRKGVCDDPANQNSQQLCEIFSVWNTDEEICIGWRYANSEGGTTVPLMGKEGAEGDNTFTYANPGESAYLKVYDSSNGSILDLSPSAELPGWELNAIETIAGTSTASNTFGCTEQDACNYNADATAADGSCWSANDGCSCADGAGSTTDCAGVCNGSLELDNCGVCDGGNASMDCAGVCDGSATTDNCGVCDDDASNDDASCTGCTNSDADNYDSGNSIDDGSCAITVPPATNLAATPGAARVSLVWDAASDSFTESSAGYTYDVYQDGVVVKSTSQTSSQITGLEGLVEYCFTVQAIHNEYGSSADQSNQACATPEEAAGDPTWRIQLKAEIDSYDQFQFSGNEDWLLHDDENFLGVATDGTYGYDPAHDAPDPPQGPGNYIKLFFDHPEWNEWVTHFTEDIVLEDDAFFSTNLTQWNVRVQSDVPGSTVIRFTTDIGVIPENYELYVELDGNYTRLDHSEETAIEFYMDGSGQKDLAVYIGNIAPQAPDNLASIGNYNSINLDWDEDGSDLNDIGNRYPATSYNVYRDDAPSDYDSNSGGPGNGPGGCGGLLTGGFGQGNTDYLDDVDLYSAYPGEGLLQESTYSYTVTGSNAAGESSEGHTVRTSGGANTFHDGRSSPAESTTGLNADPNSVPVHMASPNGTNVDAGLYEIPHNNSPDANRIVIPIGAWGSVDSDFPYDNLYFFDYLWTQVGGPFTDVEDIVGLTSPQLSFTVANTQKDEEGNLNGDKSYTWNLKTDSEHPIKVSGECGVWTTIMHLHSDNQDISVAIQPEPNNNPIAADARDLGRFGDGASVVTSDEYDNIGGAGNDFNDYEDEADVDDAHFGTWYEPHDNNIVHETADGIINYFADNADFGNNNADLYFTAIDSDDEDGMCDVGGPPTCAWDCPGFFDLMDSDGEPNEGIGFNEICGWLINTVDDGSCLNDCSESMMNDIDGFAAECTECLDAGDCSGLDGCPDGYLEDCSDDDCIPAGFLGDGWCDGIDQDYGADLSCYNEDEGDCSDAANSCPDAPDGTQYVEDCAGDGDCAPADWVGDGYCDGADQSFGFDLTCYDNDGGDCDDGRAEDDGRTPDRGAWWVPERYAEIIPGDSRSTAEACDEQTYEWFYTKASAAGFNYLDVNANGIYDIGERFSLINNNAIVIEFTPEEFWDDNESGFWDSGEGYIDENWNGIYDVGTDLGDFIPPTKVQYDECYNCIDGQFSSNDDSAEVGYYGKDGIDLHAEFQDNVYLLTLKVTDEYDDFAYRSLLFVVKDERNSAPVANEHRSQPTAGDAYYVRYGEDVRDVAVRDNADCSDNLGAVDTDNDDLEYVWTYTGDDAIDLSGFDSGYAHSNGATPDGWQDASADLSVGTHTFTFTVTDSYNATSSESTTFEIREEPLAVPATVVVDSTDLKYTIISVKDNSLSDFEYDDCNGEVYNGAHFNTDKIELYNGGTLINTWDDTDTEQTTFATHTDKNLEAETYYEYTAIAYNSNNDIEQSASSSTSTTTHDRPQIEVLTPNGAEIRSIGNNYDVDFSTTQKEYISKIEVYYLADGVTEAAGVNSFGAAVGSNTGVHVDGVSSGDATENFEISDNSGTEINYNAKVLVRVYDVGDYDGGNVQYHDDISDFPFTMAAHTLTKGYASGWHLLGPPLTPYNDVLVDNFGGSLGNWGSEWVAYNVDGTYDNLTLSLGEGYYLALASDKTLVQEGDPVIADPDCNDCSDDNFALGDLSLNKGWNLIANPLVNKVSKFTFTINDGSGDLDFEDAVDAGWIAPTIYGWFENSYVSIDRIMPFDGYWINTSRGLTIKVRPHLFENGELTRKAEDLVTSVLELRARDISGEGISDFITVGLSENADNKFVYGEDEYDLPRQAYASMGGEFIDMKVSSDLMKDIKSSEYDDYQAWTISIESEKVDNDIELSWGDVSAFEDDLHIVVNGEAINMHEENYIELTSMIEEVAIVVGNVDSYLNPIPEEFGLSAAYPNPFNPTTNLGLALNADGFVSMSVFNIRGQVVEVLVDRNMNAGYHNITWNADGISSGMYFVRVETGANTAMQKLMLLK